MLAYRCRDTVDGTQENEWMARSGELGKVGLQLSGDAFQRVRAHFPLS